MVRRKILIGCILNFIFLLSRVIAFDFDEIDFSSRSDVTRQEVLPNPFCFFENLHFNVASSTFFGWGGDIDPDKALFNDDRRGFCFDRFARERPSRKTHFIHGTTLFLFEVPETHHLCFHFSNIVEHVLGIWSFYGCKHRNDIKLIVIASDGRCREDASKWEGRHSINKLFLTALFPETKIQTWEAFRKEHKHHHLCFEKAITSDRGITRDSFECCRMNHLLGASFRFFPRDGLDSLARHVHVFAKTERWHKNKIIVTFSKGESPRTLSHQLEKKFLRKIREIPGIELHVVDFNKISFKEQINIIANTDIFISVHGHELNHILFLPPKAAVIEIFSPNSFNVAFRILAEARGIEHRGFICNRGFLDGEEAFEIGITGDCNQTIHSFIDMEPILSFIRCRRK